MSNLEEKILIFHSVFECLAAGQTRYKELFFKMLDSISSLDEFFSQEEVFSKLAHLANSKVQVDVVEKFFEKIKDPAKILQIEESATGNNILHILFKQKVDVSILKLVLKYVQNESKILNYKNKQGNTPLHFAIRYSKRIDIVELLLKAGADLCAQNFELNTPLHESVMLLSYNRELDLIVLEQQLQVFQLLCSMAQTETLSLTNKNGNTVLHHLIVDMDSYRGTYQPNGSSTYPDFIQGFLSKKTEKTKIGDFFHTLYPSTVEIIITRLIQKGIALKAKNNLKITAFQMAFLKCHLPILRSLYENGDSFQPAELHTNGFSQVALKLVEKNSSDLNECLKIFIHSGGDVVLRGSQLGHAILKRVLVEHLNLELTDILMTEAGVRLLDNGDANEIWKSLFFKLSHCEDFHFKVTTLQILFHIGINYTKKDPYGRNAEDLARLYHVHEEYKQARKHFETFALSQIEPQSKTAVKFYDQAKAFYH